MSLIVGFPGGSDGKDSPAIQDPWVPEIPWRRKWQPTPVILPGEFHEQRSLAGYSPWCCKESGMTEQLSLTHSKQVLLQLYYLLILASYNKVFKKGSLKNHQNDKISLTEPKYMPKFPGKSL